MKRWMAALPLLALVALGILFAGYALKRNPQVQPQAMVGKPVPELTLPMLETGADAAIRDAVGGVVLVNFFASWCAPCEIEHPVMVQLQEEGVRIVGVAYKDAPENSRAFLSRLGDPYAFRLIDRDGRAGFEFGVTGVPETYLVRDGIIVAKHTGPLTAQTARELIGKAR